MWWDCAKSASFKSFVIPLVKSSCRDLHIRLVAKGYDYTCTESYDWPGSTKMDQAHGLDAGSQE